jgi:uncharacterized protein YcfL
MICDRDVSLFLSLSTLICIALPGCDTVKAPFPAVQDQVGRQHYPRVTVQGDLAGFIAVDEPVIEKTDILKVTVPVRLLSDPGNPSNIQYRFLYFAESGAPARGAAMNWTFVHLPPRDQRFLVGNSLDTDAVDWRCEIRLAK